MTPTRSLNVDYANGTDKPIQVFIRAASPGGFPDPSGAGYCTLIVDGHTIAMDGSIAYYQNVSGIVPKNSLYRASGSQCIVVGWYELR